MNNYHELIHLFMDWIASDICMYYGNDEYIKENVLEAATNCGLSADKLELLKDVISTWEFNSDHANLPNA